MTVILNKRDRREDEEKRNEREGKIKGMQILYRDRQTSEKGFKKRISLRNTQVFGKLSHQKCLRLYFLAFLLFLLLFLFQAFVRSVFCTSDVLESLGHFHPDFRGYFQLLEAEKKTKTKMENEIATKIGRGRNRN